MHVTFVHAQVKPGSEAAFIDACRMNHLASVKEPGNRRFDLLQDAEDACRFILYEAYTSEAEVAAHKQTGHYLAWREEVAALMAEPRQAQNYKGLYPA